MGGLVSEKPAARVPTPRDERMRAAMSALLTMGSARKAAKACGLDDKTVAAWARSDAGKAMLVELSAVDGTSRADRIWRLVDKLLDGLEAAYDAGKIPPTALAINIGILADKARAMTVKGETSGNEDMELTVRFGGTRVRDDAAGATIEAQGAEIVVRKGGSE